MLIVSYFTGIFPASNALQKREFDILEYHNIVSVLDLTVYLTLFLF